MSDLLVILPDFPAHEYSHLLPSLDKASITVADLLALDAIDVAKRATVPTAEVKKLSEVIVKTLHNQLGTFKEDPNDTHEGTSQVLQITGRRLGADRGHEPRWISTLDSGLDEALSGGHHEGYAGGIPTGYVSEVAGESATGKTTLLLTLLLSVQLPRPWGLNQSTLYISTEAALSTTRLNQILNSHPTILSDGNGQAKPSLSRILSIQCPDLESQEHILRYQVPVAIERQNVALLVIDSIAANFRAEFDSRSGPENKERQGKAMGERRTKLIQLGKILREIAQKYDIAVVVANQVADRFPGPSPYDNHAKMPSRQVSQQDPSLSQHPPHGSNGVYARPFSSLPYLTADPLTLDHQQRFFTGWGHMPPLHLQRSITEPMGTLNLGGNTDQSSAQQLINPEKNMKTPSLGLIWTNQLACRIALSKSPIYNTPVSTTQSLLEQMAAGTLGQEQDDDPRKETEIRGWKRYVRVVFAAWAEPTPDKGGLGKQFEIWKGGLRSLSASES